MKTQLTKHYCTITGELGIIVAVKGDQQNGTQPFYDRGADSGHRTHTPKHQILNLACLPFHHIRINCANRDRTCDGGVKVLCLTAWRWRTIYPAYYVTLLRFQRAGNNVNEKFYMPFRVGPSDRSRSCGLMLPKHALFQLSYTQISVLPTRLERARRCRQEILSLRCLPFHHGSLYRRSETANICFTFRFTGYLKGIRPTATRLTPYSPSYLARHHLPV